jgi:hypothetical protein
MPRSSTARDQPSDSDTLVKPTWDTSPNSFPVFYQALLKWLQRQETKYAYICAYYYVLDKSRIACSSVNHAARLKSGLLVKGSFAKPTYVDPDDFVVLPSSASAPAPETPEASSSDAETAEAATPALPSPSIPTSAKYERHYANHELVGSVDMDLFNLITDLVLDEDTVEEYADAYHRSGVLLLIHFADNQCSRQLVFILR